MKAKWSASIVSTMLAAMLAIPATVHAVDGVVLINQGDALAGNVTPGDAPGFPVAITLAGSYRLAGNLDTGGPEGFSLRTGDVTLDLNGFRIEGGGVIGAPFDNIVVRNGTIRNAEGGGLAVGSNSRVEHVRVVGSMTGQDSGVGINAGPGSIVTGNIVSDNDAAGIVCFNVTTLPKRQSGCTITDNDVRDNGGPGIQVNLGANCAIRNNLVNGNGGAAGIYIAGDPPPLVGGCSIVGNTVVESDGHGISTNAGSLLENNRVDSNNLHGIEIRMGGPGTGGSGLVADNVAIRNGGDGINVKAASLVKDNTANNNGGDGIDAFAATVVVGNSAHANTNFGLRLGIASGYGHNVLTFNNGGNAALQVFSGVEIDTNVCRVGTTCP